MVLPTGINLQADELAKFQRSDSSESDPAANLYKLYFVEPGQNQTNQGRMSAILNMQTPRIIRNPPHAYVEKRMQYFIM